MSKDERESKARIDAKSRTKCRLTHLSIKLFCYFKQHVLVSKAVAIHVNKVHSGVLRFPSGEQTEMPIRLPSPKKNVLLY